MQSDDRILKGAAWAEATSHGKQGTCPHRDVQGSNCALVKDGLFLPVEQHVHAYCLSGLHAACSHFQRLASGADSGEGWTAPPVNRRRSIRIPDRHLFRFSEITGSDQISGLREDDAWTVDLSDHGIRFAARQFLPPGATLEYRLGTSAAPERIDGLARVVWSEPLANTPLFHVGIAFDTHLLI